MSIQIKNTFQASCATPQNQVPGGSNEFANNDVSSVITPYAFVSNQELPNFPGGVGEIQTGAPGSISDADYIFQYEPELNYTSSECMIDIHINCCLSLLDISNNLIGYTPTGALLANIYRGIDWSTAHSKGSLASQVIIPSSRAFNPAIDSVGGYLNSIPYDHETGIFDFHGSLKFERGEKLFLLFTLEAQYGSLFGLNFYSGEYNSRISPSAVDGFAIFPLAGYMNSSILNAVSGGVGPYAATIDSSWLGSYISVTNLTTTTTMNITISNFSGGSGGYVFIQQNGNSPITITAASGVTITPDPTYGYTTPNVGAMILLKLNSSNNWTLSIYPDGFIPDKQFTVTADESYVRISILSQVPAADPSNVYMVNESLSRAAEIITNGQMRVKSDYLGRTDSQPYASSVDGPGSLECITNGLLIRNYTPIKALYWGNYATPTTVETSASFTPSHTDMTGSPPSAFYQFTSGSAVTFTVPTFASSGIVVGTQILIQQGSNGQVSIVTASGVTIDCPDSNLKSAGPGSYMMLTQVDTDKWLLATHAPMFSSFREIFESLHAIHALGMAVEPDTDRSGYDRIRVEPIAHFYNGTVLMTCTNVDIIEREMDNTNMMAYFNVGYQKWEAEGTNGLDEYATKRQYRTGIKAIDTAFEKLSRFVASGYAIETTRRKFFVANTTDWRYDKDTFIIGLKRDGATLKVEQGDITNPSNIIDPATSYNWRISPVRNALRWLWYIAQTMVSPSTFKLLFNSGEGNFYAYGREQNNPLESGPLSESGSLSMADYASAPALLFKPETIKFKYPMSYSQWVTIYDNPYGKVGYSVNGGTVQYGWIQDLKYDLFSGTGEFILKPAI